MTPGRSCCCVMSSESSSEPPYTLWKHKGGKDTVAQREDEAARLALEVKGEQSWSPRRAQAVHSRLAHRGLGVFLHVVLAQFFLTLVPAEAKRSKGSEGHGHPRRAQGLCFRSGSADGTGQRRQGSTLPAHLCPLRPSRQSWGRGLSTQNHSSRPPRDKNLIPLDWGGGGERDGTQPITSRGSEASVPQSDPRPEPHCQCWRLGEEKGGWGSSKGERQGQSQERVGSRDPHGVDSGETRLRMSPALRSLTCTC